ncbi:MAG: hypothetical protein ACYTAF_04575 [Planctomycetota bacterium]|jgi:hypothetical protein
MQRIVFYTADQRRITAEIGRVMDALMRGQVATRINPSAGYPPKQSVPGIRDISPGIGVHVDIRA